MAVSAAGHRQPCTKLRAHFEHLGRPYDDLILTFPVSRRGLAAVKSLTEWARTFNPDSRAWHVHPAYAPTLAEKLRHAGYNVTIAGLEWAVAA